MPRFTIVAHDHPFHHWDLFLEAGPVLRTWRLVPRLDPESAFVVEPTPDHRLDYLEYEGPISNDRGSVQRVDGGTFEWQRDEGDRIEILLTGTRFVGRLILIRPTETWGGVFEPTVN